MFKTIIEIIRYIETILISNSLIIGIIASSIIAFLYQHLIPYLILLLLLLIILRKRYTIYIAENIDFYKYRNGIYLKFDIIDRFKVSQILRAVKILTDDDMIIDVVCGFFVFNSHICFEKEDQTIIGALDLGIEKYAQTSNRVDYDYRSPNIISNKIKKIILVFDKYSITISPIKVGFLSSTYKNKSFNIEYCNGVLSRKWWRW